MNKILLNIIIYYSLFNINLLNNNILNKYLPKNIFGIFTTIRRYQKLKEWPEDIHGCIGYINNNYNTMTQDELYENLLRVSYDSMWKDDRRNYFKPIQFDPNSHIELDFMIHPIYPINKNTGIIDIINILFTNDIYGIIISQDTKQATYLPKVFNNISWIELIKSIKKKADINDDNFILYAYTIKQIKKKLIDILTDRIFSYINIYNFSKLLIDNMKPDYKYPFIYSYIDEKFIWNSTEDIRNIALLGDIVKYNNKFNFINNKIMNIINTKIIYILNNMNDYSSQALSFLGHIIKNNNYYKYCKKLLLDLPNAEEEFEKPEIIIGLTNAGCLYNYNSLDYTLTDSIFKMNHVIQAIVSLNIKPSNIQINIFLQKLNIYLYQIENVETNYIAVAFEALCFLYESSNSIILLNKLFILFFELEKRKNKIGYMFIDGTIRFDITAHINNGLFLL